MELRELWNWDANYQAFLIPIKITNPSTSVSINKWAIFDTGFTGYVGLDSITIKNLQLYKNGMGKGITVDGIVQFNIFHGKLEILSKMKQSIKTILNLEAKKIKDKKNKIIPIQEFKIPLLGLKAIGQFNWLIFGEKKIIALLDTV